MESRFSVLQNAIAARLSALPPIKSPPNKDVNFLSSLVVPVDTSSAGDWKQEVSRKIKQVGIGIIVRKGRYSFKAPVETYPFIVEILETPVLNRGPLGSKLTAELAMETVTEGLRNWCPAQWVGDCSGIQVDSKEGKQQLTYVCSFHVQAYVNERNRDL